MKTRTRHSQTPVRVLLALEQTLLFNHHLLNTRTPVLFLLAQGQTLELNRHLLIALVWTIFAWGLFGKPSGIDSSRRGWATPPTPCGLGTARLAPSALSP